MERREFVAGLGALAATAIASAAHAEDHPHVHGDGKAAPPLSKELRALVDATGRCLRSGEICVAHCNALLGGGDTSLADCQRTALNMLALCGATFKTAAYHNADPRHLKALARVCADFCRDCAKACEPHAGHHEECKACLESCNECIKACDAYAAT